MVKRTEPSQSSILVLFQKALDALKEPVFLLKNGQELIFGNQAFADLLEVEKGSVLRVKDFWPDAENFSRTEGESSATFVLLGGETLPVKLDASHLSEEMKFYRVLAIGAKNDLWHHFHQQRLETLGMLAGGVAHDFNNMLTGILGHVTYLKNILPVTGPHIESLQAIEGGAKKSSVITQQILKFTKLDADEEIAIHDLGQIVLRTCSLLRGAISPQIQLRSTVPETSALVRTAEAKMVQVIANLVVNARDALNGSGTIEVRVSYSDDRTRLQKVFLSGTLSDGPYICLSVVDDGQGMSQDVQRRIFEPFFTTKKGMGTGLGLTTVASIVRLFQGAVEVSSKPGEGTSIHVFLPRHDSESVEGEERRGEGELPKGAEKILVVDDEFPVRNVLAVSLEHLGYTVDTAASGMEALEKFKQAAGRYDLVILDMLMPQMTGDQVFEQLQLLRAGLPVLLISGFSSEENVRKVLDRGGKGLLQKPFTIHDLARKVRGVLDEEV
jgi:two-component system, cell cycle sensor histidine kinase and response regulator CckA